MPNTITTLYTFQSGTKARAERVNNNFDIWRGQIIPVDPTTASSPTGLEYGLGNASHRWGESFIEKINFGNTTSAWSIDTDTVVEATQHLTFLINGDLEVANSEDGPRGITHAATVNNARCVLEDGGASGSLTTIRIKVSGVSITSFNLTGAGSGVAINTNVTLTAFTITATDYVTIDITKKSTVANNLHLKLY